MKKTIFFLICSVFVSCKYHCPGYDTNDKNRIPFRLGDSVVYVSNLNDTVIFDVNDFYADAPSSFTTGFPVMDIECGDKCYYQMISKSNLQLTIKETETRSMEICFGTDKPYTQIVFHRPPSYVNSDFKYEVFVNADDVITVKDLSGQRRIDSFIKVPFRGITEFHDKQTGLTWTQIEK